MQFSTEEKDELFTILRSNKKGIEDTKHQLTLVDNKVGVLTTDMSKLNVRLSNAEAKAGIKPGDDLKLQSTSLQWICDKTAAKNFFEGHPGHKHAHAYPPGVSASQMIFGGSSSRTNVQQPPPQSATTQSVAPSASAPPPAAANQNSATSGGDTQETGGQGQAVPAKPDPMPLVYYTGGARYKKMPTPHIADLLERIRQDDMLAKTLKGINKPAATVKVGGKKATEEEMKIHEERQRELLEKLSKTGGEFYALLQKGKGAEGRLARWLRSKCRDAMKDSSYPVDPASRRVVDFVDGDRISPELNWFLDTEEKELFEKDLMDNDFTDIPPDSLSVAELILYHQHKMVIGNILMSDWREFDNWYGLEQRPAWVKILLAQILEEKFGISPGEFTQLRVVEITPMLNQFDRRFPHTLVVTVRNKSIAKTIVEKYNDKLKTMTNRERKELRARATYFLPDEMRDWVLKSEQMMLQLRKANTIQGRKKTNFCYRFGGVNGITELSLQMSVDNGEWEKVDTSRIKTHLISNKNRYRGDPHTAPMAVHHRRQLLQYRSNLDDPSNAGSRRKKPRELTEEDIRKAMAVPMAVKKAAETDSADKSASGLSNTNTNSNNRNEVQKERQFSLQLSNSFGILGDSQRQRSLSVVSATDPINTPGKRGPTPDKGGEHNKKINLEESVVLHSPLNNSDEFEY